MPELPEVETVVRGLYPVLINRKMIKIDHYHTQFRRALNVERLKCLKGQKILNIQRRAKYIHFVLEGDHLLIHLGMSGRLGIFQALEPVEKHTHLRIFLDSGLELRFRDPRRFGCIDILKDREMDNFKPLNILGVEPLTDQFNAEYLYQKCNQSTRAVKDLIMDSKIVVGVGNIYANEALFLAKIHPLTEGKEMNLFKSERIVDAIKEVLTEAIAKGGTTLNDFRNSEGEPGFFQLDLLVYQRENLPCPICTHPIRKVVIGGRSSFYCPHCQK